MFVVITGIFSSSIVHAFSVILSDCDLPFSDTEDVIASPTLPLIYASVAIYII